MRVLCAFGDYCIVGLLLVPNILSWYMYVRVCVPSRLKYGISIPVDKSLQGVVVGWFVDRKGSNNIDIGERFGYAACVLLCSVIAFLLCESEEWSSVIGGWLAGKEVSRECHPRCQGRSFIHRLVTRID